MERNSGVVFNVQRFSLHDGPGIRTTVFLKGCPLRCRWCHNPESQSPNPEIMYWETRCSGCGSCVVACSAGALRMERGRPVSTGKPCAVCGECVEVCPSGARGVSGRTVTPRETLAEVLKDNVFFEQSGGGVTFSGGEPLAQPRFLEEALRLCKDAGLSTAVDTCGFAPWAVIDRIIPAVDLFLYDLKLMDDDAHRKYVGASNAVILDNLRRLAERKAPVVARLPVIPGVNDDSDNIQKAGEFLAGVGVPEVSLLPYHEIGKEKYARLGRDYPLAGLAAPSHESIERLAQALRSFGLRVSVGGQL